MPEHISTVATRRKLLKSAAALAGAAVGVAAIGSPAAEPRRSGTSPSMRIDCHAHLWPTDYLDFLEHNGLLTTAIARNIRATASSEDLAARFAMMDKAGVRRQVLSAVPQLLQSSDAAACATGARMINDAYAGILRSHPDRFLAYGAVPLPHVEEAVREARRAVQGLGFSGIAISTLIDSRSIASDDLLPFYSELDRLGTVLYIHPTGCGALSPMINDFKLNWVVGAPFEEAISVLQLLKSDIPHRFPNIRFHVSHLGGGLAYQMQRIEDNFTNWKAFPRSPAQELKRFWFDTANFHAPALRCTCETWGHDQIILGSDFPYFQDELYLRAISYIQAANLPDDARDAILDSNAMRLYRLSGS